MARGFSFSTTTSGSPIQLAGQVLHPAAAAVGEVLSVVDQALVQVAGEQRNAIGPRVVAKEMAGHADLVAAAGVELLLIKPRPVPNRIKAGGLLPEDLQRHHSDCCGPSLIAGGRGFCRLRPMLELDGCNAKLLEVVDLLDKHHALLEGAGRKSRC